MGDVEGLMGTMRGKGMVPDTGVGSGDAGEVDAESDEQSETDSERERRCPSMGMGSE